MLLVYLSKGKIASSKMFKKYIVFYQIAKKSNKKGKQKWKNRQVNDTGKGQWAVLWSYLCCEKKKTVSLSQILVIVYI